MFMLLKFKTKKEYVNFANNIRANTNVMPKVFSNYKAGFYSRIYNFFVVLMYADSNTWDHVKWPLHLKFYGVRINCKEKHYIIGIISDLWLLVLPLVAFIQLFFANDVVDSFIYVAIFSLCLFLTRKERAEIRNFLYKYS